MNSLRRIAAITAGFALAPAIYGQTPRVTAGAGQRLENAEPKRQFTPRSVPLQGVVTVVAVLSDPPLARALATARAAGAARKSVPWTAAQQNAYVQMLRQKQATVTGPAAGLGARVQAQLTKSVNGVVLTMDASQLPAIQRIAGVTAVLPVRDAEASATVPETAAYIGATALQNRNPAIDGTGVRVAVLDSGIDWTHKNLGGPGTVAAYRAVYGTPPGGGCAPTPENTTAKPFTSKVIGGYDFVGERWPVTSAVLEPDPNPIDCGGHGTPVADIIAGRSADGTWKGVAPGAQLYAVKVCSAVSTSCSGLATVLGFEFAIDPNADNDVSDAVDVINLSLGADYGLREDSSSYASQIASQFGIVVVAASGNAGDAPYITGSPALAPEAISVAQTQVSDAFTYPLVLNPAVNNPSCTGSVCTNTNWQPWSEPATSDITGPLFIPTANQLGCNPFNISLAGRIVLIRRGTCDVSRKTENAGAAGAIGVVVDNNIAGDPPIFGFGGGSPLPTTLSITMSLGNALRAIAGTAVAGGKVVATATISKSLTVNLSGSVVTSSSRGPSNDYTAIKPDIGAPGASIAAVVGTGTEVEPFSGTSGATPVISGSAALVLQAHPSATVTQVKARLMNTAETNVLFNPATLPGYLAPIGRIGSGEVRVNRAVDANSAMWDAANPAAVSLSFGYQAASASKLLRKRVVVQNFSATPKTYTISTSFRYADDQASGGVVFTAPSTVTVPANSSTVFNLNVSINPANLPTWRNSGVNGGNNAATGLLLESVEYDGYVTLTSGTEKLSLPWHLLPRRSHDAGTGAVAYNAPNGSFPVINPSGPAATGALFDVFDLLAISPALPRSVYPAVGDEFRITDLQAVGIRPIFIGTAAGAWAGNVGVQFGISTFNTWTHTNTSPGISVYIDSNNDGTDDWVVFNSLTTTNQNAVFIRSLAPCFAADGVTQVTCATTGFFTTGADLNSGVMTLMIPSSPVYMGQVRTVIPLSGQFRMWVEGFDAYFTGATTDITGYLKYNLSVPRYAAQTVQGTVNPGSMTTVNFMAVPGGETQSPSQTGFLVLFTDAQTGKEASVVTVP